MRFCFVAALFVFTGCTSSSFLGDSVEPYQDVLKDAPPELVAFNKQFERGDFTLYLSDSMQVQDVNRIVIGLDSTVFTDRFREQHRIHTAVLMRVTRRAKVGFRKGALRGTIPGFLMIGGAFVAFALEGDCSCFFPASRVLLYGGTILAATGWLVGGTVGATVNLGEEVTLYEAPLEQYLTPRPPGP